jgi:hypothetical protein
MTDPVDELLAGLRTDVPEMSDAAFNAGRTRLRTVVAVAPVTAEPKPDVAAVLPLPRKRLLRSPPRRLIATAAAAVVLAAGALVVQAARPDGGAPVASAAAQLNAAADQINPVDEPIQPGQYRYTVEHTWLLGVIMPAYERGECQPPDGRPVMDIDGGGEADLPPCEELPGGKLRILQETTTEHWVPADTAQNCLWRTTTTGKYKWLVGDDEQGQEVGFPLPQQETSEYAPPGCDGGGRWLSGSLSPAFVASLPRDPHQLHDLLRRDNQMTNEDPDRAFLDNVNLALSSGFAPADLRAALYRALALVPGLEITDQVANLDGKKGTAFGLSRKGMRADLIIDPATGQFIGMREINETDWLGLPPGTVVNYSSVANPVVVNEIRATS